jgi:glycine C-acetyltransferase
MDGYFAPLKEICDLAEKYGALVMVDDSHAVGFIGEHGRGTPETCGVEGRVDFVTGTLGKALGGASGGYVSGRKEIIALLRQRARPYLFSNTLPPVVVAGSRAAINLIATSGDLREKLNKNALYFREQMVAAGFTLQPGSHPIVPVMFGDAKVAALMASRALEHGIYVTAFSYPIVPQGKARIRVQLSAAHSFEDIDDCVKAFIAARDEI